MQVNNKQAQAEIFARYIDQLKAGGCEAVALTSMGAHFCIASLMPMSSLPLISALPALEEYFSAMNLARVGILGTLAVMGSKLYGLAGVDVVTVPEADQHEVHAHYTGMAIAGSATEEQRKSNACSSNKRHWNLSMNKALKLSYLGVPTCFWRSISLHIPITSWIAHWFMPKQSYESG